MLVTPHRYLKTHMLLRVALARSPWSHSRVVSVLNWEFRQPLFILQPRLLFAFRCQDLLRISNTRGKFQGSLHFICTRTAPTSWSDRTLTWKQKSPTQFVQKYNQKHSIDGTDSGRAPSGSWFFVINYGYVVFSQIALSYNSPGWLYSNHEETRRKIISDFYVPARCSFCTKWESLFRQSPFLFINWTVWANLQCNSWKAFTCWWLEDSSAVLLTYACPRYHICSCNIAETEIVHSSWVRCNPPYESYLQAVVL